MIEVWKPVVGYEGLYEVSSLGRVRSVTTYRPFFSGKKLIIRKHTGRILVQHLDGRGHYLQVGLSNCGTTKICLVHRIVASAFIPNPLSLPEVNHKDECKTNNSAENLEWCDHIYNNNYGKKKWLTRGAGNPMNKFSAEDVVYIKEHYRPNDPQYGCSALAKRFGISESHVCAIAKGRRWGWLNASGND